MPARGVAGTPLSCAGVEGRRAALSNSARVCGVSTTNMSAAPAAAWPSAWGLGSGSSSTAPGRVATPAWNFCSGPDTRPAASDCTTISLPCVRVAP